MCQNFKMTPLLQLFIGFHLTVFVLGSQLIISPEQPIQSRPVGGNVLLTCSPSVQNVELVTDLVWWDPRGLVIDQSYPYSSRITTEKLAKASPTLALIIQNFRQDDAGIYSCTANYANSVKLNKTVELASIFPIKWEDAPETQNPVVGTDYKVRCKVSANPSPYVTWMRDGEPLQPDKRHVIQNDGLLISNVNEGDDGTYVCRAIVVQTGELEQRNIQVEVHTPPKFEEMTNTYELVEGTVASIICNATGKPKPSFQWIGGKNREDLSKHPRFGVNSLTGMLTINPVHDIDDGTYSCVASNPAAKVERNIKLQVLVPPKVPLLLNLTRNVGTEAVFECTAKGRPLPTVSFKKFGTEAEFVEGIYPYDNRISVERIEDPETNAVVGKLRIRNLQRKDDGLYHCIAKNKASTLYKVGHITVQFPPSFENTPMHEVWSWNGRPVNLTCLAESIPNATIEWRRRDSEIKYADNFINVLQPGPFSILQVRPVDISHYGPYKCLARNLLGVAEHIVWLKQASVPGMIPYVKPEVISATSIKFAITEPQDTGMLNITSYICQYSTNGGTFANQPVFTWTAGSQYYVENLIPDTVYNFKFAAVNAVGQGPWVSGGQHRTLPRTRPSPPEILTVGQMIGGIVQSPQEDRIEVRWKMPSETGGEPIRSYSINYCMVKDPYDVSRYTDCITVDLPSDQYRGHSYFLEDLYADTLYRVEMTAQNVIGRSDKHLTLFRTAKGADKDQLVSASSRPFSLSSAAIIAIVVASLLVVLLLVDVSCFALNNAGIMYLMCGRRNNKEDNRISSEDKEPLKENGKAKVTVMDERSKKDTKQTFDDRNASYKTTFLGKNSEV